ncbi:MAG: hypothetical protein K6T73_00630 [Candidatus Bathyarchaeota archaeon]|nr:hypothetical protein [Candidatus Bathyarchaeota archaeon]
MSIEKIRVDNPQELGQMVTKEMSQIEKDLTMICSNVPINDRTTLDVLCHDSNGQLVIIQLSVNEDDIMLLQGIQSLDYVDKFKSFLKATYNKHKIDDKERPRLILIAPSFSDALKRAVESMKGMRIDLYEWEYLKLGDHKGLRLQPIFTWAPTEKPKEKEEKPPEKKREPKPMKKKEPEPEPKPEKKEEPRPEPPKPKPEPPKEEFPVSPPPPVPPKEEEPKRKLKLF